METIKCLIKPVPESGRDMTVMEKRHFRKLTGKRGYLHATFMVPATDDGCTAFFPLAVFKDYVLGVKRDIPAGTFAVLSEPVPAAGRFLTQYESIRLRKAGVVSSPSWRLLPTPDGSAVRAAAGEEWAGLRLTLYNERPAGCVCWACGERAVCRLAARG